MIISPPRTHWLGVFVLFLAGLVAAMQFAKVSPVMTTVAKELALSPVWAGLAVSILGLVGVLFAISVGAVVSSIGFVRGLRFALFGGGIIAIIGSFAPSGALFLVSRFAEGFSHLFIVVCAPALMAAISTPRDKPIALAIWGCFFGLGFAIVSVIAPSVVPQFGWRGLLLGHGLAMLLIGVAVHLVLKQTALNNANDNKPNLAKIWASHGEVFRSGAPLLLALTFCAYTILFLAVLTFLTQFLITGMNWPAADVGQFLAIASAVTLLFTLLAGVLVRWGVTLRQGFASAFLGLAATALMVFMQQPDVTVMMLSVLLMMACFGLLPGFAFANIPTIAKSPSQAALTYSAIALFGNVGTFFGTPTFAAAHQYYGWNGGAIFVAVVCLVGVGLAFALASAVTRETHALHTL